MTTRKMQHYILTSTLYSMIHDQCPELPDPEIVNEYSLGGEAGGIFTLTLKIAPTRAMIDAIRDAYLRMEKHEQDKDEEQYKQKMSTTP
jgi:hypothetical protein